MTIGEFAQTEFNQQNRDATVIAFRPANHNTVDTNTTNETPPLDPVYFLDVINARIQVPAQHNKNEREHPLGAEVYLLYLEEKQVLATQHEIDSINMRIQLLAIAQQELASIPHLKPALITTKNRIKKLEELLLVLDITPDRLTNEFIDSEQQKLDAQIATRQKNELLAHDLQQAFDKKYIYTTAMGVETFNVNAGAELYDETDEFIDSDEFLSFADSVRNISKDKDRKLKTAGVNFDRFARFMMHLELLADRHLEVIVDDSKNNTYTS